MGGETEYPLVVLVQQGQRNAEGSIAVGPVAALVIRPARLPRGRGPEGKGLGHRVTCATGSSRWLGGRFRLETRSELQGQARRSRIAASRRVARSVAWCGEWIGWVRREVDIGDGQSEPVPGGLGLGVRGGDDEQSLGGGVVDSHQAYAVECG